MKIVKNALLYLLLLFGLLLTQSCQEEIVQNELSDISVNADTRDQIISFELGEEQQKLDEGMDTKRSRSKYTFRTLNAALECTGLDAAIFERRKTLYAPSDAAFADLGLDETNVCGLGVEALSAILAYHVAEGNVSLGEKGCLTMLNGDVTHLSREPYRFYINDSRIYLVWRHKGLRVFAIDEVLAVPSLTIADAAAATDKFSTLFAAVLAADPAVAAALSDPNAIYTVFAPTNEAFGDLLSSLGLTSLNDVVTAIGVEGLTKILLYHVVEACAFSNDLKNGQTLTTLLGETVKIDLKNLTVVDKTDTPAPLVADCLDILTSNGVVHTVDKVLIPQEILDLLNT